MYKAIETFRQFRDTVYQAFAGSRDAVFEMIDAIASSPHARSAVAVEISLSECMGRKFSSVYKGLERTKINIEHLKETLQHTAETTGQLLVCGYAIYSLDHTPYPRRQARTVSDRGMVHGADGQVIGHQYSLLGRVMYEEGAWVGITQCERIPTSQTPTQVGGAQIAWLKAHATVPSIVTADSEYLTKEVLDQVDANDKQVCVLIRMKGNRVLYHAPSVPKCRRRGRPKLHGQRLKLNQPHTLLKPDALVSISHGADGSGDDDDAWGWIEIAVWKQVHVKTHPHVPGCAIRVTVYRASGQPKFKRPMWLFWTGSPDMEWRTFWLTYLKRYCIESVNHFAKNSLAWTRARLGDTDPEERWSWLVMLAYWQLLLAAPIAQDCFRPWEKPMPVDRLPTPARVQRDYLRIFEQVGTPAQPPKPRGIPPGRPVGFRPAPRPRFPVIIKG